MSKHNKNTTKKSTKCSCCGQPESIRKVRRLLVTNISHVIGACGKCLMEGRA
jgi:hypothetical protein